MLIITSPNAPPNTAIAITSERKLNRRCRTTVGGSSRGVSGVFMIGKNRHPRTVPTEEFRPIRPSDSPRATRHPVSRDRRSAPAAPGPPPAAAPCSVRSWLASNTILSRKRLSAHSEQFGCSARPEIRIASSAPIVRPGAARALEKQFSMTELPPAKAVGDAEGRARSGREK
jgi:hypothetical protein